MGLLDDDNYKPRYRPGEFTREGKRRHKETVLSQEQRTRRGNQFYCTRYPCKAHRAWRKRDK